MISKASLKKELMKAKKMYPEQSSKIESYIAQLKGRGLVGEGIFGDIMGFLKSLFGLSDAVKDFKKEEMPKQESKSQPPPPQAPAQDPVEMAKKSLEQYGIKSAKDFNKWAIKNHPDKGGDTTQFQRVSNLVDKAFKGKGFKGGAKRAPNAWAQAVKEYFATAKCKEIPKKGTKEYAKVRKIFERIKGSAGKGASGGAGASMNRVVGGDFMTFIKSKSRAELLAIRKALDAEFDALSASIGMAHDEIPEDMASKLFDIDEKRRQVDSVLAKKTGGAGASMAKDARESVPMHHPMKGKGLVDTEDADIVEVSGGALKNQIVNRLESVLADIKKL